MQEEGSEVKVRTNLSKSPSVKLALSGAEENIVTISLIYGRV